MVTSMVVFVLGVGAVGLARQLLGIYSSDGEDLIDLLSPGSPETLLQQLKTLYWRESPLNACRYCNGWLPYATKPVPVGMQYEAGEQPVLPSYSKQAE